MVLEGSTVRLCFGIALVVTLAVSFVSRTKQRSGGSRKTDDDRFRSFQRIYIVVYLCAMMADWLQGPYVYALYDSYGFTRADNAILFICGFGSSALFGTFIGAMADQLGRRKFATLYCLLYAISCLTKHVSSFTMLLVGRLTGGVATSLLFSVFESWMVSEHNRRNFESEWLASTFSLAVFGNSLVAIMAGEIGQIAADAMEMQVLTGNVYYGGYCSPFDIAILFLVLAMVSILWSWGENYGSKSSGTTSVQDGLSVAIRTLFRNPQVLCCGAVCALFEASMFIFVFMWTPSLTTEGGEKPEYGHIFAAFMVMSMLGSQIFSLESERRSIESIGCYALLVAACCHAVPIFTTDPSARFISFMVFELCVGLYFPMMGTLKGIIVPEESRSAIYNLYRVPLNFIVVVSLVAKLEIRVAFALTTVMLLLAVVIQWYLMALRDNGQYRRVSEKTVNLDTEFGLDDDDELLRPMGAVSIDS
mmetsp:Transcript_114441/g.180199  ORF Transcript_114441/g.180199 Transcript_114441/m.180199 type:complete len:476 (+) Transcript_114441:6-1433(+)